VIFHIDPPAVADAGDELTIQRRLRKSVQQRLHAKFVAIPNGAARSAWEGLKAHQEGLSAGFPDAIVMWDRGTGPGLAFVEVKTKTGSLSEQQHVWLNWLASTGFRVGVFRSVETCIAWLIEQGAGTREAMAA
jgi:hypothetical protein